MSGKKKPNMKSLIGRTIVSVDQSLTELDCGDCEWSVDRINFDDGSFVEFHITDCDDGDDAIVELLHQKGGAA